ncbi:MAG: NUDIX hydrolase [Chlamydiales bacterium]|nr:NUDIX hydrolase [Chlamydiales bacterium]
MNVNIEVHEIEPQGFTPHVHVSACFLEIDRKILLLQRAHGKLEPGTWGLPAGKQEKNESYEATARRELFEETGIVVPSSHPIHHIKSLYIRKPNVDFVFHMYSVPLETLPEVCICDEHQAYTWASLEDLERLPLMAGAKEAFCYYFHS